MWRSGARLWSKTQPQHEDWASGLGFISTRSPWRGRCDWPFRHIRGPFSDLAATLDHTRSLTLLASLWLRLCDAVKEAFAAQVEFTARQRRGGTERVVEMVDGHCGVFAVVVQDDGCSITPGDIDAASRAHRRCKDEIGNPFKSERFAARFAGRGFKPGQNVLIVPEEIERVPVEQWRGDVGRHPIE